MTLFSSESDTLADADGPGMVGASMYVAPPSSEYCNFATDTSSVADRFSVCGAVRRQLPLPFCASAKVAVLTGGSSANAGYAPANMRTRGRAKQRAATVPNSHDISPPRASTNSGAS